MATSSRFWDRIAARYARRPVADAEGYARKLAITRRYLHPDTALLEFGCGTGTVALSHAPHVGHVLATDASPRMLDFARAKARAERAGNVAFAQTTLEEFHAPDATYDAVLALNLLHLLDDRDAAIAKIHRLLKPGGVFVSDTACLSDAKRYLALVAPLARLLGLAPKVAFFTAAALRDSLIHAGFEIECWQRSDDGLTVFGVARKGARPAAPATPARR